MGPWRCLHAVRISSGAAPLTRLQRSRFTSPSHAYVFHPGTQTLEADVQAYQLTKSLRVPERPRVVDELRANVNVSRFRALVERNIVMARNFESQEPKRTRQDYPYGLLLNLLKTLFVAGSYHYPTLKDLHVAIGRSVAGTWTHSGELVAVRGRPGTLLLSKTSLPQFYPSALIEETAEAEFNDLTVNSPFMDMKQYPIGAKNEIREYLENSSFPHLHTMIVVDDQATQEVQLIQKAMLYTHARLLSQVVAKYGMEIVGSLLPVPECAQCIVTNGKRFSFLWYQLNTLDMARVDEGVKNMVCVERPGLLYSKIKSIRGRRRRRIEDLNEDILTTLFSVLLLS